MSIEPEDLLEAALRGDLPTPEAEARVRRRLLAAGVAVGNGIAATTAAASGAGTAASAAKATGLWWGLTLGLAGAVAIPSVGLYLDGRAERSAAAPTAPAPAAARVPEATAELAAPEGPRLAPDAAVVASASERSQRRTARLPGSEAPALAGSTLANSARPSQADFSVPAQPSPTPAAPSTLAEETRILDAAFAALAAGNRGRAEALLQEHERRFPAGLLQKERARARIRLSDLSREE